MKPGFLLWFGAKSTTLKNHGIWMSALLPRYPNTHVLQLGNWDLLWHFKNAWKCFQDWNVATFSWNEPVNKYVSRQTIKTSADLTLISVFSKGYGRNQTWPNNFRLVHYYVVCPDCHHYCYQLLVLWLLLSFLLLLLLSSLLLYFKVTIFIIAIVIVFVIVATTVDGRNPAPPGMYKTYK